MKMHVSESYAQLMDKARWSLDHGRNVLHILRSDIDSARLFSYGYRSQAIGAFHATRIAIESYENGGTSPKVSDYLNQVRSLLDQLEAKAGDKVPCDFRALISTLYYYDQWVKQVAEALEKTGAGGTNRQLGNILEHFLENVAPVFSGNGIYIARDVTLPQQGAFVVPNLGISIVPLIYGDHHSWNAAFLSADPSGVSVHRHKKGAEIHLGLSPVKGRTILGSGFAEVSEGYAMPIPPMTNHGFQNDSGHDHVLPFIFGSLLMTGWGVFFDVEPYAGGEEREQYRLESPAMNHSVFLERAIHRMAAGTGAAREVLIPAERAGSPEIGGLELAVNRAANEGSELAADRYRIVSVQSGRGRIRMGGAEVEVRQHDHFGVPAGLNCSLVPAGDSPLICLDAMILPIRK
jgi:hypothetical protein